MNISKRSLTLSNFIHTSSYENMLGTKPIVSDKVRDQYKDLMDSKWPNIRTKLTY
jgi:hypothetical protein